MKKQLLFIVLVYCQSTFSQTAFFPQADFSGLNFGAALALNNGDIVVSSSNSLYPANPQGKVYLFHADPEGALAQTALFCPAEVELNDYFGGHLAINDTSIAISAEADDDAANNAGAVYIYGKSGDQWLFSQKITASDAIAGDHFGTAVKISGNFLFISSVNAVYVYVPGDTGWAFSQKLTVPDTTLFGKDIAVEDTTLVVASEGMSSSDIFHTFSLDTDWEFQNSSNEFGNLEQSVSGFTLSGGKIYLTENQLTDGFSGLLVLEYTSGNWESTTELDFEGDQIYTSVAVSGDDMFIGSSWYILEEQRKFPVLHYHHTETGWVAQQSIYGTAPDGHDDYFGANMAIQGNHLLLGATNEGLALAYGQAYYLDTNSLSAPSFQKNSISLYPNPVQNKLNINNDSALTLTSTQVYSITGNLLLAAGNTIENLDMGNLSTGIYFVKVAQRPKLQNLQDHQGIIARLKRFLLITMVNYS